MAETAEHSTSEVLEEFAEGNLKGIYGDIKATFRVPIVNLVFRVLATEPDFLGTAWRQLHTNLQTVYCEEQADLIRSVAVQAVSAMGSAPGSGGADTDAVLQVFHYVNPKVLLAVGALRAASSGQYPKLAELPAAQKRQIRSGVPSSMPATITMVDPASAEPAVRAIFQDIQSTLALPAVNSDYRALACWPEYLQVAWQSLKPLVTTPEYRQAQRDLRRMVEEVILALPFRMDINPHTLRHCGLSERQLDWIRSTLDAYYALLPGLVLNIAYLTVGSMGAETAARSPFPAETL